MLKEGMGRLERKGDISLFEVNLIYLGAAVLLVTVGYYLQSKNIYRGLLITELVLILMPCVLFVLWKGAGLGKVFRLRMVNPPVLGLCALITVTAYPVGLFLNLLGNFLLSLLGDLIPMPIPVAGNFREYLINVMVIALTAAIAEEMFFRGLVLKGYEKLGHRRAVIISAVLFGVFHFNVQNFIGPVFLGIIFGYMVIKTNSILPAMAGHFINNGLSVTMAFVAKALAGEAGEAVEQSLTSSALLAALPFWGLVAVVSGNIMIRLIKKFGHLTHSPVTDGAQQGYRFTIKDAIPLVLTLLIFIYMVARELIFIMYAR